MTKQTYKLFRVNKDGLVRSLFINRNEPLPVGVWIKARPFRTKGFAFRPGWHSMAKPKAPHLGMKGRVWYKVQIDDFCKEQRPESQGGVWFLSQWIKILKPTND